MMTSPKIYGIKNCSTVKKALAWLNNHNIAYDFHDYKKLGIDENAFSKAVKKQGWNKVINQRGTTWRNLPQDVQENMNADNAINIAQENPSIIKRPILMHGSHIILGFDESAYSDAFKN